jgi:hypothetical protein
MQPPEEEEPMRIWFRVFSDAHLIASETIENTDNDTRTHKVFAALEEACVRLDLGKPIWLDTNIREFSQHAKTRFRQDNFVEEVSFDYMEMLVLEED